MKISILCSDHEHPVYPLLQEWQKRQRHEVELVARAAELSGGDLLFLISCGEIIGQDTRKRYLASLVIHASDLPVGRGWSPHVWQVLQGRSRITVTLLEAEDAVDSGAIWAQRGFSLEGHELYDEINDRLFRCELELMDDAVENFGTIQPQPQDERQATYYPRRTPGDSRIDPLKSLAEQFDLLRVADPRRFPAFFELRGHRYNLAISKADEKESQSCLKGGAPHVTE